MPPFQNLVGNVYGELTVTERAASKIVKTQLEGNNPKKITMWKCKCTCGKEVTVIASLLKNGNTASCGCVKNKKASDRLKTHGKSKQPEYKIWKSIKGRCLNEKDASYSYYGGRGITLSERWLDFENFWNDMGERPSPEHSIDRIDVNKGYQPDNCRWVTLETQARNKRPRSESGVNGVCWKVSHKKWQVTMIVNGKNKYFGLYEELQEAIQARKRAELKYWETPL